MNLSLVVLLAAASTAPRVAVVVHPTGFSDEDSRRVQDKVGQEVSGTGVELWALSKSLEVRTECLLDRTCAREVLRAADAAWLVWVEAVRAGGQVQLEAHLLDAEGRTVAQDESAARADDVVGSGTLIAPAIVTALKGAATQAAPATTPVKTPPATTTTPAIAPLTPEKPPAPPADQPGPDALSPMAVGGITAIGAGAVLAVGGGALAFSQIEVIRNPDSLGAAKQGAANVATAMLAVTAVGVCVGAAGGVLLALGI